jgi:putative ABC transport system permease protein
MGIAAFLLILEYISFEKSVNTFHTDVAKTYRLLNEDVKGETWPQIEPGWATRATEKFPDITAFCRFEEGIAQGVVKKAGNANDAFRETNIGYADGNFFSFFSFPIIAGNANALKQPNTVFITQSTATKYFGKNNPIGEQIELNNQFGTANYTVAGVFSYPENSDIRYDMVFSLETLKNPANLNGNGWADVDNISSQYIYTYFKLNEKADYKKVEQQLTALRNELGKENDGIKFRLQPMQYMHLPSSLEDTYQTSGNLKYVYILGIIALLILAIAWFNYINLTTANALKRANEVGVRKVIGASRSSLVFQFLGESVLMNVLALALAILMVVLLQPLFNDVVGKNLSLRAVVTTPAWVGGILLLITGSLATGAYTAYSLSSFKPVDTLKGKITRSMKGVALRKGLVVAQFTISIALILATVLIFQQLQYMQNKNLGVNTDQVLVVRGPEVGRDSTYKNRRTAFMNNLSALPFVKEYSVTGSIPGGWYNFATAGFTQPGSKAGDELKSYSFAIIDQKYLNTYQIPLKAGRNFTAAECAVEWDENSKVMLNEKAVQELGFSKAEDAIRTRIQWDERSLEVIGVVAAYHHTGLQRAIDPIIFYPQNNNAYISIRLATNNVQASTQQLEKLFKSSFPGNPYEYFFADENFNKQYITEQQYGWLFSISSIWAIVIACLGLFGLTTFTVESRTREVGIRKVLGASAYSITRLISIDFLKLVSLSAIIAFPIAWFSMNTWLQDFAYRIEMSAWIFLLVGISAVLLALVTISFKAISAAMANPVKSIRTE